MNQANVYTSVNSQSWYTDKCAITTGHTSVTYQVYAVGLGNAPPTGNIYSDPSSVNPDSRQEIYVGTGNQLTIVGTGFTAEEIGTATSATAGVYPIVPASTGPTLVDSATRVMSGNSTTTVAFTAAPMTVIVVASGSETADAGGGVPALITDISGMGLTWLQRAVYTDPDSDCGQTAELWYAINDTGNPITDDIVITFDNVVDDQSTVVSSYSNCDLITPWTASGPSYSNSLNGVNATVTMTVAESNTVGIVFFAIPNYGADVSPVAPGYAQGWNAVNSVQNGGAEFWEYVNMSYLQFATPQTNLVVNSSGDLTWEGTGVYANGLTTIADALVGA
jgi:hypothetical protein